MTNPLTGETPLRNLSESYEGLAADTWNLFGGDRPEDDLAFFAAAIRHGGGKALDVACGSGKHLIPYLQAGLEVDGLDSSKTLLQRCAERGAAFGFRPVLFEQKMQDMRMTERYQTIFISVGSFMLLSDLKDARQTLARCFEQLLPGGRLYITLFRPDEAIDPKRRTQQTWGPVTRPEDGTEITIRRWTDAVDYSQQILNEKREYVVRREGRIVQREDAILFLRWYELKEVAALFAEAGFKNFYAHAGFTPQAALDNYVGEVVVRGEK